MFDIRNSFCCLSGNEFESRRLIRIFGKEGKVGSDKHLSSKTQDVCGITVTKEDSLSTLIFRKCEGLVSKASDFRQKSQNKQMLVQNCLVKCALTCRHRGSLLLSP